jgi:hypothetical protein
MVQGAHGASDKKRAWRKERMASQKKQNKKMSCFQYILKLKFLQNLSLLLDDLASFGFSR